MRPIRIRTGAACLAAALAAGCGNAGAAESGLGFSTAGWFHFGRIVASSDTAGGWDLRKGMQGAGAQIGARHLAGPLRVEAGLGVRMSHYIPPGSGSGGYAPMLREPFVARADLEYAFLDGPDSRLAFQAGWFPYDYAAESRNLGLYLFRGPVYPGLLVSGYPTKNPSPLANTLGFRLHHRAGSFEQDLLLSFENEWPTYWDASPAYVASYAFGRAFRITGGVQLNHFLPVDPKITDPRNANVTYKFPRIPGGNDSDSVFVAFRGVKLMARAALDPKAWAGGPGPFGPEDLKLYGEVAVLGLDDDRAHNDLYGPVSRRMPAMLGFNLPAFGFLDRIAAELEYYSAPWVDDPTIFEHTRSSRLTPIPKLSALDTNDSRNDIKWSVHAEKTVAGHVRLGAQAASDHSRPGIFTGYGEAAPPRKETPFLSPSEWYWTARIDFFF